MDFTKKIVCVDCRKEYPADRIVFECDHCRGPLDVVYDYSRIKKVIDKDDFRLSAVSHWKYWPFFGVNDLRKVVSLDEGGTPLLESRSKTAGESNLWFKYEAVNPTGSFKDRGSTVEVSKALEHRAKHVVLASTGNMGASVATYAARAGIACTVYLPTFAPKPKANQIKATGARVIDVKGTYDDAVRMSETLRAKKGYYLTGDYVYRMEGEKSVGFEIIDQMQFVPPKYIVMPVGNATLFSGVYKSMIELKEVGMINRIPKLVAVQSSGCSPVVNGFNKKEGIAFVKDPKTVATAIACGHPVDAVKALRGLRATDGLAVSVTDNQIIAARKELAKQGLFVEPSGAVSYAGWKKLGLSGEAVCVLTGHGLKDPRIY